MTIGSPIIKPGRLVHAFSRAGNHRGALDRMARMDRHSNDCIPLGIPISTSRNGDPAVPQIARRRHLPPSPHVDGCQLTDRATPSMETLARVGCYRITEFQLTIIMALPAKTLAFRSDERIAPWQHCLQYLSSLSAPNWLISAASCSIPPAPSNLPKALRVVGMTSLHRWTPTGTSILTRGIRLD